MLVMASIRPSAWILISLKTPGKIYRNKSLKNFYLEIIYGLKFGPFSSSAILLSSEIDSSLFGCTLERFLIISSNNL